MPRPTVCRQKEAKGCQKSDAKHSILSTSTHDTGTNERVNSRVLGEGQASLDAALVPTGREGPPCDDDADVGGRKLVRNL